MPSLSDTQESTLSAAPNPPPPLSGLLFGAPGLSGVSDPQTGGFSGRTQGAPGIAGGPGLDILSLLLQLGQGGGGDTLTGGAAIPNLNLFQGALGQAPGGFGAGLSPQVGSPFFQQIGQQGAAGQTAGQTSPATGSGDPLALLQKIFGLGSQLAGVGGALGDIGAGVQGYATAGGTGPQAPSGFSLDKQGNLVPGLPEPPPQQPPPDIAAALAGLTPGLAPGAASAATALSPSLDQLFGGIGGGGQGLGLLSGVTEGPGGSFQGGGQGLGLVQGLMDSGAPGGIPLNLGTLGELLGGLGSATGLAHDIQSGIPLRAVQDLYSLYGKVQPLLYQAGVPLPATPSIGDVFKLFGGGPDSALGSLGATAGQIAGIAGPVVGALGGLGLFGQGPGPASAAAIPGAALSALATLGPALASSLGAGLGVVGPGLTALSDELFTRPIERARSFLDFRKSVVGSAPSIAAQALQPTFGDPAGPGYIEPSLLGLPQALQAPAERYLASLGALGSLEQLNTAVSNSLRAEHGIRFPDLSGYRPILQAAGQRLLPKLFAAQQALQQAGGTAEVLRAGGFPLAFNPTVSPSTRTDALSAVEGGGAGDVTVPVGLQFLNTPMAQRYANLFGYTGALPDLGGLPLPGTPEYQAAQFGLLGKNIQGFPDFTLPPPSLEPTE